MRGEVGGGRGGRRGGTHVIFELADGLHNAATAGHRGRVVILVGRGRSLRLRGRRHARRFLFAVIVRVVSVERGAIGAAGGLGQYRPPRELPARTLLLRLPGPKLRIQMCRQVCQAMPKLS